MDEGRNDGKPPLRLVIGPPPPISEGFAGRMPKREQVSPLDIILATANALWQDAINYDGSLDLNKAERASYMAEKALPYVTPRLASVSVKNEDPEEKPKQVRRAADEVRNRLANMRDKRGKGVA